ncbi:MAG: hypothetical protein WBA44_12890 [Mesorhizobium sp.]
MSDMIYSNTGYSQVAVVSTPHQVAGAVSISAILGRIEEAIDVETDSIGTDPAFDIRASNARKSRYLYELNRALKGVGPSELAREHRDGVIRLRTKLVANEAAIRAHLAAVNEVATLIQDAIQRSETDGTYSSSAFHQGQAA